MTEQAKRALGPPAALWPTGAGMEEIVVIDGASDEDAQAEFLFSAEDQEAQIIEGDCVRTVNGLPDDSIDLVLFSPPYDAVRDYENGNRFSVIGLGQALYDKVKDGGICAVVIGDGTKNFAKSLTTFSWAVDWSREIGWRLFECCIYSRHGNPGAWWTKRFRVDHEYILIFFKGKRPKHFDKTDLMVPSKHAGKIFTGTDRLTNGGFKVIDPKPVNNMKCRGTIWIYSTSNSEGNKLKLKHPATFPDALARDVIRCFSDKNDTVLDPMCGSGTTCVVARQEGRKTIGVDISEEYCIIARKRLREETYERERR